MHGSYISATEWQTMQTTGTTIPPTTGRKAYVYCYDELSRLTNANFSEYISNSWQQSLKFNEKIKSYDLNGNIKGIERRGSFSNWNVGLIDNLTYYYSGNQLFAVDDQVITDNGYDFFDNSNFSNGTTHEYLYDANGNLKKDANKEIIEIKYNFLNLPSEVNFTGNNKLSYLYDANGTKLRQDVIMASIFSKRTDFISNFVFVNNAPAWINFDEGRVIMFGNTVHFTETHLKDHLGNTRVVFGYKNNTLLVKQVSSYYPFGMNIKGLSTLTPGLSEESIYTPNEYLYNGKMFQDELGLDWLDYGARMYDAVLGRFMAVDRFAEKYYELSLYQYVANNPICNIDVNGDSIWYTMRDNVITMHVTGKVFNTSSDNINVKRAASDIASGINSAFSGEFKVGDQTYTLQTDIQLEAVSSMGDVAASDHLFNIVDSDGEGARGAVNEIGGKVISVASVDYANDNLFSNTFSWNNTRSAVHEFGHTAGLTHESASGWGNLMTQKGSGTNVTSEQRLTMMNAVSSINKGTNSYMGRPNPYLHGYNPVTRRWETGTVHRVFNPSYYRKR